MLKTFNYSVSVRVTTPLQTNLEPVWLYRGNRFGGELHRYPRARGWWCRGVPGNMSSINGVGLRVRSFYLFAGL